MSNLPKDSFGYQDEHLFQCIIFIVELKDIKYEVYFDFTFSTPKCFIYKCNAFDRLLVIKFDFIPPITPHNAKKKLPTIMVFS
jgi:hypothetical protein